MEYNRPTRCRARRRTILVAHFLVHIERDPLRDSVYEPAGGKAGERRARRRAKSAGTEVEGKEVGRIAAQLEAFVANSDLTFGRNECVESRKIEAIDGTQILFVATQIFGERHTNSAARGNNAPAGLEKIAHCPLVRRQNFFAEEIVTHNFRNENVHGAPEVGLHVKRIGMFGNDADGIREAIARDAIRCHLCDRGVHFACDNLSRAGAHRHHRQETCADFEDARIGTDRTA